MRLTYLTGVSGAGKTTVAETLTRMTTGGPGEHPYIVDLDTDGRPNAGHVEWLRWRAAELLHVAAEAPPELDRMIVTGICWPHAVVDCNAWPAAERAKIEVEFVMLDVPHRVIRERLADREGGAAGMRKGFKKLLRYNSDLADVLRRQVTNQRHGHVLAAEHQTPDMLAEWLLDPAPPGVARWPIIGGGHA